MNIRAITRRFVSCLPDRTYLLLHYFFVFGKFPDLRAPKTFNEKLQWLKLNDRKPVYHEMVDKLSVKTFAAERIGEGYIVPTLGVWDRPEDIDYDSLPDSFALKCTHDSGSVVLCRDKAGFDRAAAERTLRNGLAKDYYKAYREWPYKGIPRKILAEKFLPGEHGEIPADYKVMCFAGEPKLVILHQGRYGDHTMDFYDTDWNMTDITRTGQRRSAQAVEKPPFLEEMLRLSAILAKDVPHLRVDWYISEGKLRLGELTFFNASGFGPFEDPRDDLLLGSWIRLKTAGERTNV